jgi:hypothetical protein
MDSSERGALSLVRIIAVLLVVWSLIELGLYWGQCHERNNPKPVELVPVLVRLIPAVFGFVGLIRARSLAAWVCETFDL